MAQLPSPEDRPDPSDRMPAVRARVPEHVAIGQISTGVIVVTGATEYILDFVRNLPRPNMIVARVVLPHAVMPQFTEALSTNIALYRQRFGELPSGQGSAGPITLQDKPTEALASAAGSGNIASGNASPSGGQANLGNSQDSPSQNDSSKASPETLSSHDPHKPNASSPSAGQSGQNGPTRHASPQEVYDDLKLRDELLSGSYANAVMIGHGPHEFCFDFITNFYPQSAVSCRVFMSAGHVGRLLDSLKASWDQLRPRLGGNP